MKFALECVLKEQRYKTKLSADIQRDVERLIFANKQQEAYTLYQTDVNAVPLSYQDFCQQFPIDEPHLTLAK